MGEAPSRWAIFHIFFEKKKSYFNTIRSHFARIQSHLKVLDCLTFESQLKKLSCSVLLLLAIQVQNTFKILHFGVKLCK